MAISDLVDAAVTGDVRRITELLDADPSLVKASDSDGASALHHAALHAQRSVVRLLVERGANINAVDGRHEATPTGWAVEYLRGLGGLLATEIEDFEHAVRTGDLGWATRFAQRFPQLLEANGSDGVALRKAALASGNAEMVALFSSPGPGAG